MKFVLIFLLYSLSFISAQDASVYLPELGYMAYYENTPLDSLNNPVESLSFFSTDSFAFQAEYNGKFASAFISRTQSDSLPFIDTNYIHTEGSTGWMYMDTFGAADSIPGSDSLGIGAFLSSFSGWYSVFRFDNAVDAEYEIVKRDTTFMLDTLELPIRIDVRGRRFADETISTPAGTFASKKFLISTSIGIVLSPVIPPISIIDLLDTMWIAENRWIVKDVSPSVPMSFAVIGGANVFIPGSIIELVDKPTGVKDNGQLPDGYSLTQNYPNPFNPETSFEVVLPENTFVELAVFNTTGEQIALLYKGYQNAGKYNFNFDGKSLSSGVYYYRLKTERFTSTRKMLMLK